MRKVGAGCAPELICGVIGSSRRSVDSWHKIQSEFESISVIVSRWCFVTSGGTIRPDSRPDPVTDTCR